MAKDSYLGEFRRGPAIFTVFAVDKGRRFRVDCSDGNGPGEVCTFGLDQAPAWHGAWNGDEWCPWIESEARRIVKHSLKTRAWRWANRCLQSFAKGPPQHRRARPAPSMPGEPQDRIEGPGAGRSWWGSTGPL